ncbi:MAG: isoprenylcysteine carboxylmethyltransferase family protein [Candidatus Bathyarchaeota archaeon]|nr:isoprenylcysteine carboxylmethyltransferase family protein [Candidatus Bathyarchaeota archaeon]
MRKRLKREMHSTERADNFLFPTITIVTIGALILSFWDFIVLQQSVYRFGWLNIIGFAFFIPGIIIYLVARLTLGRFFSKRLNLIEGHKLKTHGIYKYVRHPSYIGSILFWLGLTLLLNSILGFLVMLPGVILVLIRIPFEEKMLINAFGQQYIDYMKRTKKLIPCVY